MKFPHAMDSARDALRAVMGSRDGRMLVWHLIVSSGLFSPYRVGSNAESVAFDLGRRSMGTYMWNTLQHPDMLALYRTMQDEAQIEASSVDNGPLKPRVADQIGGPPPRGP